MASITYSGPKHIVVLGGGVAGVAAFDALTAALAACPELPDDLRVTLIEAEDEVGGRATSWSLDGPSERHPHAPYGTSGPHGIHFVWGSYAHLERLMGDFKSRLSGGTATYCAWMAPPDLAATGNTARVTAVHVCDPTRPETAWDPRARRVLEAFQDASGLVRAFESLLETVLGLHLSSHELLSYMDILFDEENLGPELRWSLLVSRAVIAQLGSPETNPLLRALLGKSPADADVGEMLHPLFSQHVAPRMKRAHRALTPLRLFSAGRWPGSHHPATHEAKKGSRFRDDLRAIGDIVELLGRDATKMVPTIASYDPRASGFLKNALKAAFSNPYPLDIGTVMRDAQFGLRSYEGAILRLFDGDDSRGMWRAIAERAASRLPGRCEIKRGRIARRLLTPSGSVVGVELADTRAEREPDVPALRPREAGPTVETVIADAVISSLLPRSLAAILDQATPRDLTDRLETLGGRMNETLNLQLFFPRKMRLPVVDPPAGFDEVPALSISNLEGPFTIVVDLERGWSREKFEAIALVAGDVGKPFKGTGWELVGTYPECFTFDPFANPGRVQWPTAVQEKLAAITNDPADFDPGELDERQWVHDTGTPGHMPQPMLGEVRSSATAAYQKKWTLEASPIIAAQTMRLLADLPGLDPGDARYLREQASLIEAHAPSEVRWTLLRACQAENRFFSAEPGLFEVRPHARFPTAVAGLWVAGDWTRNGLNLQAMEAATISGLQAACGVLERMRAGGLMITKLPLIDPSILPDAAWDSGHEV